MSRAAELPIILMADDDEDDRLLSQVALAESGLGHQLRFVEDGQELMDYLRGQGRYAPPNQPSLPGLILLDLNMPRKNGREVLAEIRAEAGLRHIPVVVMTTSQLDEDVYRAYDLGANSFIVKPVTFSALVEVMTTLGLYWFRTVRLPKRS